MYISSPNFYYLFYIICVVCVTSLICGFYFIVGLVVCVVLTKYQKVYIQSEYSEVLETSCKRQGSGSLFLLTRDFSRIIFV